MIKENINEYKMNGNNYNQRMVVHLPNGISRTILGCGHAGNEPKVIVYDTNGICSYTKKN